MLRRAGLQCYFERDPADEPERLEPEREAPDFDPLELDRGEPAFASVEPARDTLEREDPDFVRFEPDASVEPARDTLEREEADFAPVEPDFARGEPDFARVDPDFELDELDERDPLDADEPDREREELDDPLDEPRDLLDEERRELDRDVPLRRSAAGISSLATAFASCEICFSRNFAMRSSSRRMPRASLAVSLSFTASASASMPV